MINCDSRRIMYLPSVYISIVGVGMLTSIQHVRRYYMGDEVAVSMRLAIVPKAELGALACWTRRDCSGLHSVLCSMY